MEGAKAAAVGPVVAEGPLAAVGPVVAEGSVAAEGSTVAEAWTVAAEGSKERLEPVDRGMGGGSRRWGERRGSPRVEARRH